MADFSDHNPYRDDSAGFEPGDSASLGDENGRPDELPPVKPPSAGFLVQLFLVPALIVLAVVAVWALFGKMVSGEQDWRAMVGELRSENEHRRWRAALGLAQMLKADHERGAEGQQLSENPEVARAFADLLQEQLEAKSTKEDDLNHQVFLTRTLGFLDVPDVVLPVLQQALEPEQDRQVRKNAIASIAVIAGRAADREEELGSDRTAKLANAPSLVDDLIVASQENDALFRQLSAFTLGLLPTDDSRQRLNVLLADADEKTRVNAAVGLARQGSTAGLPVFQRQLEDAAEQVESGNSVSPALAEAEKSSRYFWLTIALLSLVLMGVAAVVSTSAAGRAVAGAASIAALLVSCWLIYGLVVPQPTEAEPDDVAAAPGESQAERYKNAQAARFEGLVVLRNTLKAVGNLNEKLTAEQRTELAAAIEPISNRHREPSIQLEAARTLQRLRGEGSP